MLPVRRSPVVLTILMFILPVIGFSQTAPASDTKLYQDGISLFENGLFEHAALKLEQFIAEHPDHKLVESAGFYRARAWGKTDSLHLENYYEEYIHGHPNTSFARKLLIELGNRSESSGRFTEAIEYYTRALSHKIDAKQATRVYYWLAEAAVSAGDKEEAREYFLTLADKYPDSEWAPKALYARGRLYLTENKFDASSDAFELLKERYPNDDITRRIGTALGESYYQQGKYEMAIEAFKNALPHLDEELTSKAVYLIAESYNYLNQFDQASTYYLQYINRNKGTDKVRIAHYGLGWIYHKQQIYHWAAEAFQKAADGSDELARKALYYKAVNEKMGSRYDKAIETFRKFGNKYKEGLWVEEGYYEWAVTAYEMGIYSEAIEVLLDLVRSGQAESFSGKIYTLLGEAYFANKEYSRALQAFETAEKMTDIDPGVKRQARFQKAWVLYRNQAYKQAQPIFEDLYRTDSGTGIGRESLFWSADCHFQINNYGPASNQFAEFVRKYPDHELTGAARYSLGWSYFKMGNYENAVGPLMDFLNEYDPPEIALYPYDTDTKLRIGDAYYALGDYDEAINYYNKAIGAEPGGDYAMFQVANSYYRADQTYEAVTTFRRMLRIYPYSRLREQAQYNIAYIYLNTGNYTQAINEFQTVIQKYPNTSWAARSQYNIGDAYYNAGEYDRAVDAYREVLDKYPRSDYLIEAVNGIQYAQLSAGKADSSSAILEDFLADHPQTSTADRLRFRQADNLFQSGDYQGAIREFRQYIRITNNRQLLPDAYFNLANAYEQTGNTDQAVQTYQRIVDEYPQSERYPTALIALGRLAYDNGNYRQSFDYYRRLQEGGSRYSVEARIGKGEAQLALGNVEDAKQEFDAALQRNENYDPARVGLGKVALEKTNYSEAEDLFNLVAESNTTEIGAEAQYLLGVTRQRQEQYERALDAYSNVTVLYEAFDNWVAKALLNSAECYIRLGNRGEARNTLNSIIEKYPGTPEARRAQQMLQSD